MSSASRLWVMPSPMVIAHKCGPLDADPPAAENSIAGMRASLALGADAIEIDVRLSLSGTPVLMHDVTARRTGGFPVPVRLMSEQQLSRTRLYRAKEPIPTLAAMLAAVPDGVRIAADIKDPRVMRATIEVARAAGKLEQVMLWCRSAKAVRLAASWAPEAQLAYLHDSGNLKQTEAYIRRSVELGAHAVSIHERATSRAAVDAAHDAGLVAYAWALTADSHRRLLDAGPDGIVTDYPGVLRKQIGPVNV
ncbi:MAG: glycerophosphoryl diester phosphodiesterase [Frankiales bacterium]|nr:glycerophosphoryl diester phosphodiesterase [Frankiales bacterium]